MTRKEAIAVGLSRYQSKKACTKGHGVERYTANGRCVVCARNKMRDYRAALPKKPRKARTKASMRFTDIEFVYEAYNEAGDLLYVGRTNTPYQRVMNHRAYTPWWDDVTRIIWSQHPNPEFQRISQLRPQYNVLGRA